MGGASSAATARCPDSGDGLDGQILSKPKKESQGRGKGGLQKSHTGAHQHPDPGGCEEWSRGGS
jgi:hypothetical protein